MSNRNVIVTGAGSGIGAAVAQAFIEAGDKVFLVDVSLERLRETAEGLDESSVSLHSVDVTDAQAIEALIAEIIRDDGSIDVLVSAAGVFDAAAGVLETSPALWERIIGINLTGTYNVVKPVAHAMADQSRGRIVLIGSIAAQRAMPDGLAYCASKAALEGMVRRLAFDLGPYGVTANLVAPGVIKTGIRATSQEILGDVVPDTNVGVGTDAGLMDKLIPLKRGGEASEVAATVLFLASEGAGYISGDVIHVDGGWIAV